MVLIRKAASCGGISFVCLNEMWEQFNTISKRPSITRKRVWFETYYRAARPIPVSGCYTASVLRPLECRNRGFGCFWGHGFSPVVFVWCVGSGLWEKLITLAGELCLLYVSSCVWSRNLKNEAVWARVGLLGCWAVGLLLQRKHEPYLLVYYQH
jgi:hypothetical protein